LLADRSDVHHAGGIEQLARGKVGNAEASGERDPAAASDGDGYTRDRRFPQHTLDDARHLPAWVAAAWLWLARGGCERQAPDPDMDRHESWL